LQHKGRELDLGESLDGYPAALQNIIKNQARQISYSHVPDGGARRNQETKRFCFLSLTSLMTRASLNPSKKENDAQD